MPEINSEVLSWIVVSLSGGFIMMLGWIVSQMGKLETRIHEHEVHAARTYVQREDYKSQMQAIHKKLDRIMELVGQKADR